MLPAMSQTVSLRTVAPSLQPATRGLAVPALFIATCLAGLSADPQFDGQRGGTMITAGVLLAAIAAVALVCSGAGQWLTRARVEVGPVLGVAGFVAAVAAYAVVGVYLFG